MKIKFFSRDLLCGRHALDLRPYLFFAPFSILIIPLTESSISEQKNFLLWIFASSLSFIAQLIFLKLLQIVLINKGDFQPFPVWVIFTVGGVSGAIRGLISFRVPQYLELQVHYGFNITGRVLLGAFVGICVVPTFAVLSNQISIFMQRRQNLMAALVQGESLKFGNQEALQRVRQATQIAIASEFSLLMSETRKQINNVEGRSLPQQYELISDALTSSAENLIRPLSHRLMETEGQDFPSPPLRSIFFLALKRPILPLIPTLLLLNITVVVATVREVTSFTRILLICTIQTVFSSLQILSIKAIVKSFSGNKSSLFVPIFVVGSAFANVLIDHVVLRWLFQEEYQFLQSERLVVNFLWMLTFFAVISFIANLVENESSVEAFILGVVQSQKIDQMLADQEILRVKQDIARYLHGNLQSRVMALGLSLKVRENKDQLSMDSALSLTQSLLDSPFAEFLAAEERTLLDEVSFNAAKWEGLLRVAFEITVNDSELSQIQKRAVGAVVEEALANALRHGFAKEVEIKIFHTEQGVTVAVLDDGIGPRYTPAGLGSRLYDAIATRGWSLQHRLDNEGTILELRI